MENLNWKRIAYILVVCLFVLHRANSFNAAAKFGRMPSTVRMSSQDVEEIEVGVGLDTPATSNENNSDEEETPDLFHRMELKNNFLTTIASTDRGQLATPSQKETASCLIKELSLLNPIKETTSSPFSKGTWELIYSDTQLFRSSPFFMAGRAVCKDGDEAERYDWFCDMHRSALAISTIGKVRQIISSDKLVSEFEVKVGAIPFLNDFTPFAYSGGLPAMIEGAIVSSASIETGDGISIPANKSYTLFMDSVEIKGSNIPLLRSILDSPNVKLRSRVLGSFLEDTFPNNYKNPKPIFETIYLDEEGMRISRDQDGKLFVYVRVSESEELTDYESIEADLGLLKLIQGFNDKITKFYI